MATRDIIVIGASAGGVEALIALVRDLPPDLHAALFVVLHTSPSGPSYLPRILARVGPFPAAHAQDGEVIRHGQIFVAPPDHHLILEEGRVRLSHGPRENNVRPAADVLFRSAARAYGPRVIGVVLSGTLDDGAAGLITIKQRGGTTIVQDPEDAIFPGMPTNAIAVDGDYVLPVAAIPAFLAELTTEYLDDGQTPPVSATLEHDVQIEEMRMDAISRDTFPGTPSSFACPECGGVLWEIQDGAITRYRCRVGHAYSPDTLLDTQTEHLEAALWAALRGLEEKASLAHRLAARSRAHNQDLSAQRYTEQARDAEHHAVTLRNLLMDGFVRDAPTLPKQ